MRILLAAVLGAIVPAASVTAGAAPASFRIGGAAFTMTLPPGYCQPTGAQAAAAQLMAAADSANVTHLSLFRCDTSPVKSAGDYTLIKTPIAALTAVVSRAELLRSVGAEFDKPEFAEFLKSGINDDVAAGYKKVIPAEITFDGTIKPLGRDDVCAYMGGTVTVSGLGTSYKQALGMCITSVGERVVTVIRYGKGTQTADVLTLLREAKALVPTIRPTAG